MIKSALKLLAILVVGILIYNLFLGTDEEKQGAKKIVGEAKNLGVALIDLLKTEKNKFDRGKYDQAMDEVGDIISSLKEQATKIDPKYVQKVEELEKKRLALKKKLKVNEQNIDTTSIKNDAKELFNKIESIERDLGLF